MKRYLVPVVAGVTVFGAATAFAASLTVDSNYLGSGNDDVASCAAIVTADYTALAYDDSPYGYKVGSVPITSHADCAGMSFKISLTGPGVSRAALPGGEISNVLNVSGGFTADFSAANILAADVTGVSVVITG